MHLPKLLAETLRLMRREQDRELAPICAHCDSPMVLVSVIEQPVYKEPDRKLHQFRCACCGDMFEELR